MKYCIVEIKSQTATFRNAEFQNFHKTLTLPPPTTLIGLAGAALGLSPKKAQDYFYEEKCQLGVYGKSGGLAKDLWKYNDFKTRSIILREILFKNHFFCAFGIESTEKITQLGEAFLNPKYALTMGNSDSLAKVVRVIYLNNTSICDLIENCIVEGDIISEVLDQAAIDPKFSIYQTSEPIAIDIPVRFSYNGDYGMRNVIKRKTLSFISKSMQLNLNKNGLAYDGHFIPLINL